LKSILIGILLLININSYANICIDVSLPENDDYKSRTNLKIESFDGTEISANLLIPKNGNEKHPTVIFVNSWMLEEHEYLFQAIELAKRGFQVLSYSTRGWGCSGGMVNVIGSKDIKDLHKIIDWLESNTQVDVKNIGMAGISYGGGMTLMALAKEPRIKTGFAMSAWGSLNDALYGNGTPRKFWGSLLVYGGFLLGNLDPEVKRMFDDLMNYRNTEKVMAWAKTRSPLTYIEEVNKRNAPVYISNNFGDNLFQPNNVLNYFSKLKVPKILELNQGTHATGEVTGLFTLSNHTFKKLHHWFDYWLRDIRNEQEIKLNTINIQTDVKHKRETISSVMKKNISLLKLNLQPSGLNNGVLKTPPYMGRKTIESFRTYYDTDASTGIPLLSALVDGNFKFPVQVFLPDTAILYGSKFVTPFFKEKLKIRGIPSLSISLSKKTKKIHLNAYLYDVNLFGVAKLITHGTFTSIDKLNLSRAKFDMVATAYDIPLGNRLALVIDGQDPLYQKPEELDSVVVFEFGKDRVSSLHIPFLK
jgi:predicted acyl esterase